MWELVRTGEIESVKIGASRRILRAALVAYIEAHRSAA
jgi:excisionase family DNA binding protein